MDLYAEVIINSDAIDIDRPFTYRVSPMIEEIIQVGHRVKVPFGMKNKETEGFVIGLKCELKEDIKRIKEISKIIDEDPILSRNDLKLIDFLRRKYLCKHIDAIRCIIPTGLLSGIKKKYKTVISFNKELDSKLQTKEKYVELIEFIKKHDYCYTKSELINDFNFSSYQLNKLVKDGFVSATKEVVERFNKKNYIEDDKFNLTDEQSYAIDKIISSDKKGVLLQGVTGSGKTEVYMNLVKRTLEKGKGAIILVPEISLTPQMIERFKGRFGADVALFHSKLSVGERFDEWFRVTEGKANLVIGARSAIFMPVNNLGLIVLDEEHENTYKSEQNPKYDTREVAEFLAEINDCRFILGSATPSYESYYKAENGMLEHVTLKSRVNNKAMPDIQLVDMREELKAKNYSLLSRILKQEIQEALSRKEQVILFLNRRGLSTFVSCRNCGFVFKCPSCDVSLTYHKNGYLVCHYCGRAFKEVKVCPKCKSKYVKFFGAGTERVEIEVKKLFPEANVIRMDVDTTQKKDSYQNIYNNFKSGKGDILIGTQMVTKGLDFKNVTLVGVLAADISLNIPDYRAAERTYQIITQVSGRAGRGDKKGRVFVQSYTPDNYVFEYALNHQYTELYKQEIMVRKSMNYPPFSRILIINCMSKNQEKLIDFIKNLRKSIEAELGQNELEILGPSPCIISKINNNFRWQIIIKGKLDDNIGKKIKDILYHFNKSVYNEIRVSIDINPNNLG